MNIGVRQLIESDVFDYAQLIDVLSGYGNTGKDGACLHPVKSSGSRREFIPFLNIFAVPL